ncbi:Hypothetical predicted protein, partial [Paramuricea clavata]
VRCNDNRCQEAKTERKCEVILYYKTPHYTTGKDAKNSYLQCNATLLEYKRDIQKYISNRSRNGIWIGLTKNASNFTESVRKATLFKIRKCESRNIAGDFRNVSCSNKLLPSFCKRGRYKDRCKGNNSRCFLPVHDRMTWFDSFAHCKSLNRALDAGNISKALLRNANLSFGTSHFWTGKIYETNIDTSANWTWLNGSLFKEWDKCKVINTDVGCSGCGFWKNGTIYLTSNCSQKFSYFCDGSSTGVARMKAMSRSHVWWPKLNTAIEETIGVSILLTVRPRGLSRLLKTTSVMSTPADPEFPAELSRDAA